MTVAPISGGHLTFSCTNDQSVEMAGDKVMLLYMYTATHGKYLVTSARVLDLSNLRKCLPLANRSALKNRRDIPKQQQQRSQRARCFTIVCFEGHVSRRQRLSEPGSGAVADVLHAVWHSAVSAINEKHARKRDDLHATETYRRQHGTNHRCQRCL